MRYIRYLIRFVQWKSIADTIQEGKHRDEGYLVQRDLLEPDNAYRSGNHNRSPIYALIQLKSLTEAPRFRSVLFSLILDVTKLDFRVGSLIDNIRPRGGLDGMGSATSGTVV